MNTADESATAILERNKTIEPTAYHLAESPDGITLDIREFNLWYGASQALHGINMSVQKGMVTALIGPSGCGKSTLLRSLNRMNDLIDDLKISGQVLAGDEDIYRSGADVIALRKRMGMVFQKPNPFAMSIYDNVIYPLRVDGVTNRKILDQTCERALRSAAIWDEVKDRIKESALGLSGGSSSGCASRGPSHPIPRFS